MNTPFEKRICYTICICQMTAVLSCVSIVYLTVAIYSPAYRTLNSGFSEDPVMCTTISNKTVPNCEIDGQPSWSSCGEWCLSKSSGSCTQIKVDVRRNGSNLRLEDCDPEYDVKYCDGINPKMKVFECIKGECAALHGIFNCTKGTASATGETPGAMCRNLTSVLSCILTTTETAIGCHNKKACMDLDGLHDCQYGKCSRVRPPYKCEKRCISIKTGGKSVLIRQGDVIYTASCGRAISVDDNREVWPLGMTAASSPSSEPPLLTMFCTNVMEDPNSKTVLHLTDCFNGTLLEPGHFGNYTNITYILSSHLEASEAGDRLMDPSGLAAPLEQNLLIKNNTPLYINYEGCVNTLILNECETFHAEYGGDGSDLRSQSRFRCFYTPNDTQEFVVLRFSTMRTMLELMIAVCVPVTLSIVSCITLVICTRIIHVGDDSHFTFQCCGASALDKAMEKEAVEAMAL